MDRWQNLVQVPAKSACFIPNFQFLYELSPKMSEMSRRDHISGGLVSLKYTTVLLVRTECKNLQVFILIVVYHMFLVEYASTTGTGERWQNLSYTCNWILISASPKFAIQHSSIAQAADFDSLPPFSVTPNVRTFHWNHVYKLKDPVLTPVSLWWKTGSQLALSCWTSPVGWLCFCNENAYTLLVDI